MKTTHQGLSGPSTAPDETPTPGPGQEPEFPGYEPTEYPDNDLPGEVGPIDPTDPGMPPLTD